MRRCPPWVAALLVAALVTVAEGFLPQTPSQFPTGILRAPLHTMPNVAIVYPRWNTAQLKAMPNNNDNNNINPGGGLNMDPSAKLLLCILIDIVGVASFAAPGLGEATDVAWAPISALLVNYLFGNGIFTALAFAEELLPGFDIIPTATIAWFVENSNRIDSTTSATPPPPPKETPPKRTTESTVKRPNTSDVIDVEVID